MGKGNEWVRFLEEPLPRYLTSSYRQFEFGERHVHRICEDYVWIFMLEGTLFFSENDMEITLNPGEYYIQQPGLLQDGRRECPAPLYYYIHFRSADAFEPKNGIEISKRGRYETARFVHMFDKLESISAKREVNQIELQGKFLTILADLLSGTLRPNSEADTLPSRIMDYLWAHYNAALSDMDLEKEFNYSRDYLGRLLKKTYGTTPLQYLHSIRVKHAKELLANTDQSLSIIADRIGFGDASQLYKAFKKSEGESPGKWRARCRGL